MGRARLRPRPRAGRTGRSLGPLVLVVPLLGASLFVLHRLESRTGGVRVIGESVDVEPPRGESSAPTGWRGELVTASGVEVELLLSSLAGDRVAREFQAAALRERFGLGPGTAWRLILRPRGGELRWTEFSVVDRAGGKLTPLIDGPAEEGVIDPVRALYLPPTGVADGGEVSVVLWGEELADGIELVLGTEDGALRASLAPTAFEPEELPRSLTRLPPESQPEDGPTTGALENGGTSTGEAQEPSELDLRDAELARLRVELDEERNRRRERELEWWEYNRALATLGVEHLISPFPLDAEVAPKEYGVEEPQEETDDPKDQLAVRERVSEILVSMRALLRVAGAYGFEPFELGALHAGYVGPVILRLLDDRGRLAGTLAAERLRLEASRSAHLVTLILEEGYEAHLGERVPFENGERRIVLAHVEPQAWIESLPELFSRHDRRPPTDDGLWDLKSVRAELNELLGLDIASGWYRVRGLGGVSGNAYVDVNVDAFDASGKLERRFFVDRMRIDIQTDGVLLLFEGGAMIRGDEQRSFLGGTHRIYLPNAPLAEWRKAQLPGIAQGSADPDRGDDDSGGGGTDE